MNFLFSNVYVINMDKDVDRLQKVTANLKKHNIEFKRFPAVNGKELSDAEILDKTTLLCRTLFCSKAIIGSSLSHMSLWKKIAESDDKWHMILEDDVSFNDDNIEQILKLAEFLDKQQDIDVMINLNCHNAHEMFCRFTNFSLTTGIDLKTKTPARSGCQ